MFDFFEMTPDLVCIASKEGFFKKVNKAALDKLEYSEEELFASPIKTFQHPEDRDLTARTRAQLIEGTALVNFENRYITKTGKILWLHWTSIYLPDKKVVFAIAKDITTKKKVELETEENYWKFKGLATHFKSHIEKERKSFAFELHEEVAQLAAAIKMDIDLVNNASLELPATVRSRMENASQVSQLLIDKIRKISFSLSPNLLEQLGLNATLEWLCKEFNSINNIPCNFLINYNEAELTHEMKLDFFRICQESLSNVMRHANATVVNMIIEDVDDKICLSIADDGKGFDVSPKFKTSGFTNMRELASIINGELAIESYPGKGTKVSLSISKHFIKANSTKEQRPLANKVVNIY